MAYNNIVLQYFYRSNILLFLYYYVEFERSTGWKVHSDYEPLPLPLQKEMDDFFLPFNNMLFELIGRNFSSAWVNK
jgi:hypothetical protein